MSLATSYEMDWDLIDELIDDYGIVGVPSSPYGDDAGDFDRIPAMEFVDRPTLAQVMGQLPRSAEQWSVESTADSVSADLLESELIKLELSLFLLQ